MSKSAPKPTGPRSLVWLPFPGLHLRNDTQKAIRDMAAAANKPIAMIARELVEARVRELRRQA